nr:MAG: mannose-1-phosphate guanyltransferase [Chloroflexota bacterium]
MPCLDNHEAFQKASIAMQHFYAMIMAGGGGTRLWPMSRNNTPKQLLPLVEEQSMFRISVERLAPLFPPDQIYVVTGRKYLEALRKEAPEIPAENFITEPYGRDSGPAAALGLTVIARRDPEATVAILTADHHIANKEAFRNVLVAAHELAGDNYIVTLGISPSVPSTAFGYIRRGKDIREINGFRAYESLGFSEKPNMMRAMEFISTGEYSWNSGMFILKARQGLEEFRRQQPEMYDRFARLAEFVDTRDFENMLDQIWDDVKKISLDFAIMEGAERIAVIPVDIGWSDVGTWDALFDVLNLDEFGNGFRGQAGQPILVDTRNTLVYSDKLTVTIGVEDLVVVDTPDVIMICHKKRAQDVKDVVNKLREARQEKYL